MIEIKNLSKAYKMGEVTVPSLKGINLEIKEGEFVAIMGASGSGKSTLLRQIGLLDTPTAGEYLIENFNLNKLSEYQRSIFRLKYLGYIFQEYALLDELNVIENVYLPLLMRKTDKMHAKAKALTMLKEVGLDTKSNRLKSQLSGGERQRVAIARSLVNDPKLILADEPCANLDSKSSKNVLELLKNLNNERNQTIVMVTHEPWHKKYVDRVIELKDGELLNDIKNPSYHRKKAQNIIKKKPTTLKHPHLKEKHPAHRLFDPDLQI